MSATFNQIKNIATQRPIDILKEDVKAAYVNMTRNNTDAKKIVYHALNEALLEKIGAEELDLFEQTYR